MGTTLLSCLSSCFRHKNIQPFISPYATKVDYSNRNMKIEMNLSPRFVAYYEVTLLQRDKMQEPKCPNTIARNSSAFECVAIGLSLNISIKHRRMPGWDKYSYGYHGDDGGIFHDQGQMLRNYGPTFTSGDTVGCGIDYIENAIFFTHNGTFLGYAWKDVNLNLEWFPTVGIDTECPLEVNFGKTPFIFDLKIFQVKHSEYVSSSKYVSSMYNCSIV